MLNQSFASAEYFSMVSPKSPKLHLNIGIVDYTGYTWHIAWLYRWILQKIYQTLTIDKYTAGTHCN